MIRPAMNNLRRVTVFLSFLAVSQHVSGQVDDNVIDGAVEEAEIVVQKDRQIELSKERKLYEFIKWKPKAEPFEVPKPDFKAFNYPLIIEPVKPEPPSVNPTQDTKEYHQYARIGFGNYNSPIADLNLITPGDPNKQIGLTYNHLSFGKGAVEGSQSASAHNRAMINGRWVSNQLTLQPYVSFRHDMNKFYGSASDAPADIVISPRNNIHFGVGTKFRNFSADGYWHYGLDVGWKHFSDNYDNQEGTFYAGIPLSFKEKFFFAGSFQSANYKPDSATTRIYYRLNPYYRFWLGELTVDAGVSVSGQNDDVAALSDNKIFPYINASFAAMENLDVSLTLDAGYIFQTMDSLAADQPYLATAFSPQNSERLVDLSLGANFTPVSQLSIGGKVQYTAIRNMPFYLNTNDARSELSVFYDSLKVKTLSFGVFSRYYLNQAHDFGLDMTYNHFEPGGLGEIVHRPTLVLNMRGNHVITPALSAQWKFGLLSGIRSLDLETMEVMTLATIARLDIQADYQINERFGAFISLDNAFNQSFVRYQYYPQRQATFRVGASIRF